MRRATFLLTATLLCTVFAFQVAADAGFEEDVVLAGPNAPGSNHRERWRFDVAGGESFHATVSWEGGNDALTLSIHHQPDGQAGCTVPGDVTGDPECFLRLFTGETASLCEQAYAGDLLASSSPLQASLVAPGPGTLYVDVIGVLSEGSVPFHMAIDATGDVGAPDRFQNALIYTTQGMESRVCPLA